MPVSAWRPEAVACQPNLMQSQPDPARASNGQPDHLPFPGVRTRDSSGARLELSRRDLEGRFGFEYLEAPRFPDPALRVRIERKLERVLRRGTAIGESRRDFEERRFLGSLHAEAILRHAQAPLVLAHIDPRKGYGLLAGEPLPRGAFVGEYTGEVTARWLWLRPRDAYSFRYPWALHPWGLFPRKITTSAGTCGSLMRFLNHSEAPNTRAHHLLLGSLPRLVVYATRSIAPGDELTLNYGAPYWRGKQTLLEPLD